MPSFPQGVPIAWLFLPGREGQTVGGGRSDPIKYSHPHMGKVSIVPPTTMGISLACSMGPQAAQRKILETN